MTVIRGTGKESFSGRTRDSLARPAASDPALSHSGDLPTSSGWSSQVGRLPLARLEGGEFQVRSRRGWNMTSVIPELRALPPGLVLDGELVAWKGSEPYFQFVCRRVPYCERRKTLDKLKLDGSAWVTAETSTTGERSSRPSANTGLVGARMVRTAAFCIASNPWPTFLSHRHSHARGVLGVNSSGIGRRVT